jgi:hypothetical protein
MAERQRRPDLPARFSRLDDRFFCLGQNADNYEATGKLDPETVKEPLASLSDIVTDEELYRRAIMAVWNGPHGSTSEALTLRSH